MVTFLVTKKNSNRYYSLNAVTLVFIGLLLSYYFFEGFWVKIKTHQPLAINTASKFV